MNSLRNEIIVYLVDIMCLWCPVNRRTVKNVKLKKLRVVNLREGRDSRRTLCFQKSENYVVVKDFGSGDAGGFSVTIGDIVEAVEYAADSSK